MISSAISSVPNLRTAWESMKIHFNVCLTDSAPDTLSPVLPAMAVVATAAGCSNDALNVRNKLTPEQMMFVNFAVSVWREGTAGSVWDDCANRLREMIGEQEVVTTGD